MVYEGDSAVLKADRPLLERYVGVTGATGDDRKARREAQRSASQAGAAGK